MSTVTLEKAHFDTLLRRANFCATGLELSPMDLPMVTIPKFDHDRYVEIARQYEILKKVLYSGGISDETFNVLINGAQQNNEQDDTTTTIPDESSDAEFLTQAPPSDIQSSCNHETAVHHKQENGLQNGNGRRKMLEWSEYPDDSINDFGFREVKKNSFGNNGGFNDTNPDNGVVCYPRECQRTILIRNLPKSVTYADIVEKIRGGMLLEIQLRPDRTAVISFLFEEDARHFYRHVKRNDMYVCDKRVDIAWNSFQFTLTPHVADRIANGATRNLVVRSIDHRHTEEAIREHADHIHNLVVISVDFTKDSAVIHTNSVHNAMFLKTCLSSRAIYKQSKVVWGADECAVPIEPKKKSILKDSPSEKFSLNPAANRFDILNTDGTEMGSTKDDIDASEFSFVSAPSNTGGRWV